MKPAEHPTKTPHTATRIFVALGGLLAVGGSGARARRSLLVLVAALGLVALAAAPAFAAAPEVPGLVEVEPVTESTSAFVRGALNPTKAGEAGTYEFLYKESKTASKAECESPGASKAPVPPGMSLGEPEEHVSETLTSLKADTEYTVCLLARNNAAGTETAVGAPALFRTAVALETPEAAEATVITGASATLNGILNPGHEGEAGVYRFVYRASASECQGPEEKETSTESSVGHEKEVVSASVTGLLPDTTYTFCLLAHNTGGERGLGAAESFTTTTAPPTIPAEETLSVTPTTATLTALISPGALPTTYRIQYGKSNVEEHSFPEHGELSLPASSTPVPVREQLIALTAGSEYHFRFVATNAEAPGGVDGADATFSTTAISTTALSLPDNRAYELVSTIEGLEGNVPKEGQHPSDEAEFYGEIEGNTSGFRAAADGEAVAYVGGLPPSGTGGYGVDRNGDGDHYLSERGAAGWNTSNIEPVINSRGLETGFSADLSSQIFEVGDAKFNEEHGGPADCGEEGDIYSRTGGIGAPSYQALFSTTREPSACPAPVYAGVSADGSHTLFESWLAFAPQAVKGAGERSRNLYDSVGGQPQQVNVLPDGEPESHPDAVFGGLIPGEGEPNFSNDISADGSRIFWSDLNTEVTPEDPAGMTRLFVREDSGTPQAKTAQVDASVGGGGEYWTASTDGSTVLFTKEGSLYEFDVSTEQTTTLAANAKVLGVSGISDDGGYVAFVAEEALTPENVEGKTPAAGQPNLYLFHAGTTTFIATLEAEDNVFIGTYSEVPGKESGDWRAVPGLRAAAVAPDGGAVAFMSRRALTGYDNYGSLNAFSQNFGYQPEVFVYEVGTGRLACASCQPAGAPPVATAEPWEEERGGYVSVSGPPLGNQGSTFMSRFLNAEGTQVYFNSSQPLVARDTNHRQDVYEWEAEGGASCPTATSKYGGCVLLLSGGDAAHDAFFIDASESGGDVFFTSRERLVPRELNETVNVYDARVDGGFPESSLACTGTGCQGSPPAPPIFATPSSVTFNGVGNFPPPVAVKKVTVKKKHKCKQGFVEKKVKNKETCVKKPQKKKSKAKKSAHINRRAPR